MSKPHDRLNLELLLLSLCFEANEMPPEVTTLSDKDLMGNLNAYLTFFNCIPFTKSEIYAFTESRLTTLKPNQNEQPENDWEELMNSPMYKPD